MKPQNLILVGELLTMRQQPRNSQVLYKLLFYFFDKMMEFVSETMNNAIILKRLMQPDTLIERRMTH
jgi:hypothetical protein